MGASGAIFGSIAVSDLPLYTKPLMIEIIQVTWVDLFAHWQFQYRPVRKLVFMIIELVFVIAMGFIPCKLPMSNFLWDGTDVFTFCHLDVDNFGTFPSPLTPGFEHYLINFLRTAHLGGFLMGLLVGTTFYPVISTTRKHKMIMWGLRLAAIPLAIVLYVVLTRNFYTSDPYAGKLSLFFSFVSHLLIGSLL